MKKDDVKYWNLFFALAVSYIIGCVAGSCFSRNDDYTAAFFLIGLLLGASLLFFSARVLKEKKVKKA